jgi:formylglycine-generating enzyme required for sulfatase activity
MTIKIAPAPPAFDRALRSFQTGGITMDDLLGVTNEHLATGASRQELLLQLRDRESVEPLTEPAHTKVVQFITDWPAWVSVAPADEVPPEAETIILDDEGNECVSLGANALADPSLLNGRLLLDRYQLTGLVGEGGMSRVYRATDLRANPGSAERFIAVKVLLRPLRGDAADFAALQQETNTLRALNHPNIVRLYGCERDDALIFLTMEYLSGVSLYKKLHEAGVTTPRGLPAAEAYGIVNAIAQALEHAHQHQVVHGDVKPGNVIVTDDGTVKVIDFGIAASIGRPMRVFEQRDQRGASALTPRYASPQLLSRQAPTPADDVYALACVAYELLTGVHPFDDGRGGQVLAFPPPVRPALNSSQYAAIVRGLEFERRHRTRTVREFISEFDEPARGAGYRAPMIAAGVGLAVLAALFIAWAFMRPAKDVVKAQTTVERAAVTAALPAPAPPVEAAKPGMVVRDCPTCAHMTVVPAGRFLQGAGSDAGASPLERPQHLVAIEHSFAISTNPVSVAEFGEFAAATGRVMRGCEIYDGTWHLQRSASWENPGFPQTANHPVTCVSHGDAAAYAEWLTTKTGHRYRLPSASEWEYAARAGAAEGRPWESAGQACARANVADRTAAQRFPGWDVFPCDDRFVNTSPVGSFTANAFGLNDMLGNVFQWTDDCWYPDYSHAPTDGTARRDGSCGERELRGGSWFSTPKYVTASYRNHFAADHRTSSVGIRLVRELEP